MVLKRKKKAAQKRTKVKKKVSRKKSVSSSRHRALECDVDAVEAMSRKKYLKYYISVLENQIDEASKILKEKKKELRKLK